jgi:DNA-binding CsgD family transcriptional regulator
VAAGGSAVQPAITDTLMRRLSGHHIAFERFDRPEKLTAREVEILRLVAGGYASREIADALHLTEGTVKNHMSSVLWKLGVRDRTRAALRGLELGLIANADSLISAGGLESIRQPARGAPALLSQRVDCIVEFGLTRNTRWPSSGRADQAGIVSEEGDLGSVVEVQLGEDP